MATIANLAVMLTANIGGFSAGMSRASGTLGAVTNAYRVATDSAAAWERTVNNVGQLKLAGADTLTALRGTLATAKAEVNRFRQNLDVRVAVEIAREHLDESWIKARTWLHAQAERAGVFVAASVVSNRARTAAAWLSRQRQALTKPITAYIAAKAEQAESTIAAVRTRLTALTRFRAVRIALTAVDGLSAVARAARATVAPLVRLATRGITIAIHATHAGVTRAVAGVRSAIGGMTNFVGGAVRSLVSSFGMIGLAIGAIGGAGVLELVRRSAEAIDSTAKLSDRMGIATEKLGGLEHAARLANVSNESLTTGLEHMLKNLAAAADKTTPAAVALASMGLSAEHLTQIKPDQAFSDIAEGLKNITNPAERARAAVEIFGKAGQQLLPMMMAGKEGIAAAQAEAEKLGITFNRVDAAKVEAANHAVIRLQETFNGVIQTLAIQLAPFIDAAATKLTNMATSGQGAAASITNGFGSVLKTVAAVSDYLAIVQGGWNLIRAGASFAIGGILDGLGYLIDGLNKIAEKLHITAIGGAESLHNLGQAFYATGKDAFAAAGQNWKQFSEGTNAKAATQAINEIERSSAAAAAQIAKDADAMNTSGTAAEDWANKLKTADENAKKVTSTLEELHKQAATFGMDDGQKKLFDLKAMGAGPEQIAEAQAAIEKLKNLGDMKKAGDMIAETQKQIRQASMTEGQKKMDDLSGLGLDPATLARAKSALTQLDNVVQAKKAMEKSQSDAKSIFEATRTPMEKYEQQITKLSDLLKSGGIDWTTYGRAVRAAREQLESAGKSQGPQLLQAGSVAAQRYAFDQSKGQQQMKSDRDETAKLQYNEVYQSRLVLQRIENKLTDSNADAGVTVDI